ncbi:MAG: winged helix DNA-binding domain-containing protein [Micrococcales bacterium]|nr:winged helix DNA-binding domain-containing protein [Micrococcales bacterium]
MSVTATREQVLAHRVRAQQLDRETGTLTDTAVLDLGAQDTGPDGGSWALAIRGLPKAEAVADDLVLLWTLRGAPHFYRRDDVPSVLAAVAPWSDRDAAKRIFDASKPLRAKGIGTLDALDTVAAAMRSVVSEPMVKGEVSARLGEPYVRFCRPCNSTHLYEQTFRLGATRAGLELEPGTSPPVLRPIVGLDRDSEGGREPAGAMPADAAHDVVRGYLRFFGPATAKHVAAFVDAPLAEVKAHWPSDVIEVQVDGDPRSMVEGDLERLLADPLRITEGNTRLLGPYDLLLQARDRELMIADPARRKALWPVLGRPGAVVEAGEIVGMWRPRAAGQRLTVTVETWAAAGAARRRRVEHEAERLAAHRGLSLKAVALT